MDAIWVVLAVILLAIVAVAAINLLRARRSARLRDQFGPEYERTLEDRGDQKEAEAELAERVERREQFEIRPLAAEERERHADAWQEIQKQFVDDPPGAVAAADVAIGEVMAARGYPTEDFEERAADVSVDHPTVVENYRAGHAISERSSNGDTSTEDLRQAMVHYRALFAELLENGDGSAADDRETGGEADERGDETSVRDTGGSRS